MSQTRTFNPADPFEDEWNADDEACYQANQAERARSLEQSQRDWEALSPEARAAINEANYQASCEDEMNDPSGQGWEWDLAVQEDRERNAAARREEEAIAALTDNERAIVARLEREKRLGRDLRVFATNEPVLDRNGRRIVSGAILQVRIALGKGTGFYEGRAIATYGMNGALYVEYPEPVRCYPDRFGQYLTKTGCIVLMQDNSGYWGAYNQTRRVSPPFETIEQWADLLACPPYPGS